jgi:hypothetical protein
MPRATERVYKEHTERMGQNICSSVPKILPEQLHPVSNNEDILPRNVLPLG